MFSYVLLNYIQCIGYCLGNIGPDCFDKFSNHFYFDLLVRL